MRVHNYLFILVVLVVALLGANSTELAEVRGANPVRVMRASDFTIDVARGLYPNMFFVNKFAHNPDVDGAEDIWHGGGDYTGQPLTDVEAFEIYSSDAADTSAGTGCQTVTIFGLDTNYDQQSETVSMSGVTPVDTVNTYRRLWRAYCATAGSGATNAGEMTIRHTTTTANVFAIMQTGTGSTQISAYTVPNDYNCFIRNYEASLSDNTSNRGNVAIWIRTNGGSERLVNHFGISTDFPNSFAPQGTDALPEKTDLKMRVTSIQNANGHVEFTGSILCIKNGGS